MLNFEDQITAIHAIQDFLLPLKSWVIFLNFFDTPKFYFILLPLVWFLTQQKYGFRLLVLIIFSGYLNSIIKQFYEMPRPFILDPSLMWIKLSGYGLPSGGAQSSLLLALFAYDLIKNKKLASLSFLFTALISFSRIALGAHFFTDVVAGWFVALGIFACYKNFYLPNEEIFFPIDKKKRLKNCLILFSVIPGFFMSSVIWKLFFFALGLIIGSYFFDIKNVDRLKFSKKCVLSSIIGLTYAVFVLGVVRIFGSISFGFSLIQNFIFGFCFFFIASLVNLILEMKWEQKS